MIHQRAQATETVRKAKDKKIPKLKGTPFLIERRRFPRVPIELPFDYSLIEDSEANRGIAVDASEGGLLVYLVKKIDIGTLLRMEMLVSRGTELTMIKAIVRVVWADSATQEGWAEYRCGVQFLSFYGGDLSRLRLFLKEWGRPARSS